jgi:hypothetical protein
VASITVLTALGGRRSVLECIRTIVSWYAIFKTHKYLAVWIMNDVFSVIILLV